MTKTKRNGEFIDHPLHPCPECGQGKLVLRQSAKTNHRFIGCTTYPLCTYTARVFSKTKPPTVIYPSIVCAFTLPDETCQNDAAPLWLVAYAHTHGDISGVLWKKHCSLCHTETFESYSKNIKIAMAIEKKIQEGNLVSPSVFTPDPALLHRLKALKAEPSKAKTMNAHGS